MGIQLVAVVVCIDSEVYQVGGKEVAEAPHYQLMSF